MKKKLLSWLKVILIWLVIIVGLGEVCIRLFIELPIIYVDEKTACYRYDELLGWYPLENTITEHESTSVVKVQHNADGFRDGPYDGSKEKKTIAVIGDSFVWGYGVEQDERLTDVMEGFLPECDILNMGVSGYGTDQEFLLLQKWFPKYQPDAVVLVVHSNDSIDSRTNYRDNYYKPYFIKDGDSLALQGTPVPTCYQYQVSQSPTLYKSKFVQAVTLLYNSLTKPEARQTANNTNGLLLAIKSYLDERNVPLLLIFTYEGTDAKEVRFLDEAGFNYAHLPTKHKFQSHGFHWTPEGHKRIAFRVLEQLFFMDFLVEEDVDKNYGSGS